MAQFTQKEAEERLDKICQEYSKERPENPVGFVTVEGYGKAVLAKYITYALMAKILYVLGRSSQEYIIKSENDHVIVVIRFFS